ncbi:hypothetical protein N9T29_01485 [Candidatus Pelagibacter sp.]|nr:hypothetical protein [Candidatus Pelagibacter sp.]
MKKISLTLILLFTLIFFSKSYAIEVSSLQAEKRLIFNQLFSKHTCAKIYTQLKFGLKKKLDKEVMLESYHNLKRVKIDENEALLTLAFDQRTVFYKERGLETIIFNVLAAQDFSDELANINKTISNAKSKKIVVCEYDLNRSIEDGSFFNFNLKYDNSLRVESNVSPKVLIYYDGTIEYAYYDEEVQYAIPSLNYRKYPFDSHELRFLITSEIYSKLYFERSDKFKFLLLETKKNNFSNISFPGWTIKKYVSYPNSETLEDVYSDYQKHFVVSELTFVRNWVSFLYKMLFPLIGITILIYFAIYIRIADGRIAVLSTLLLAFVAFDFVTVGQRPELPYITLLDWLIFLGYAMNIITILFSYYESYFIRQRMVAQASDLEDSEKSILDKWRYRYKIYIPIIYFVSLITGYFAMLTT